MNYNYQGIRVVSSNTELSEYADNDPIVLEAEEPDAPIASWKRLRTPLAIILLVIAGVTVGSMISSGYLTFPTKKPSIYDSVSFDNSGRYVVRNFDDMKPSANFLAGLGGLWGVPMVRSSSTYLECRRSCCISSDAQINFNYS